MYNWFQTKVALDKVQEDGCMKKQSEVYLVDALNYTEAEARIIEETAPFSNGQLEIKDIKHRKFVEVFDSPAESDDKWYECKVLYVILDEKTCQEKKTPVLMLVKAGNFDTAVENLHKGMGGSMASYEIHTIKETAILDIFKYKSEK